MTGRGRIGRLGRLAASATFLALALGAGGCAELVGDFDAETKFTVPKSERESFFAWNEITLSQDVNSVDHAELQFVVLEVADPSVAPDLTFLRSLTGEAVTPTERTLVVRRDRLPKGDPSVPMDVVHDGDLRPFFLDGRKIRVEWKGTLDPSYPYPEGGIEVRVAIRVNVE